MGARCGRRPSVVHGPRWQRVRTRVRCAGDVGHDRHDIQAPAWALFWPWHPPFPQYVLCTELARLKGYACQHLFTFEREGAEDVRVRQAGGDD